MAMIEAKELRIGNAVWFECDNLHMTTQGTVTYIKEDGKYIGGKDVGKPILMAGLIDQWGANREEHIIDLEGIPLTPEILEQCGFDDGLYELFANSHLQLDEDDGYNVFIRQDDTNTGGNFNFVLLKRSIKYLHELQNLFYTLTGKELTINASLYA